MELPNQPVPHDDSNLTQAPALEATAVVAAAASTAGPAKTAYGIYVPAQVPAEAAISSDINKYSMYRHLEQKLYSTESLLRHGSTTQASSLQESTTAGGGGDGDMKEPDWRAHPLVAKMVADF